MSPFVRVRDLRNGALFELPSGELAVKSEYSHRGTDIPMCVLLSTGEYAEFKDGADTMVREYRLPTRRELWEAWQGIAGPMEGHEIPCRTIVNGGKCDCGFTLYQLLFKEEKDG